LIIREYLPAVVGPNLYRLYEERHPIRANWEVVLESSPAMAADDQLHSRRCCDYRLAVATTAVEVAVADHQSVEAKNSETAAEQVVAAKAAERSCEEAVCFYLRHYYSQN